MSYVSTWSQTSVAMGKVPSYVMRSCEPRANHWVLIATTSTYKGTANLAILLLPSLKKEQHKL